MFYTDNPIYDYERYSSWQEEELEKLPICCECNECIQTSYYYEINDEPVCFDCIEDNHKKSTEDFIA